MEVDELGDDGAVTRLAGCPRVAKVAQVVVEAYQIESWQIDECSDGLR